MFAKIIVTFADTHAARWLGASVGMPQTCFEPSGVVLTVQTASGPFIDPVMV